MHGPCEMDCEQDMDMGGKLHIFPSDMEDASKVLIEADHVLHYLRVQLERMWALLIKYTKSPDIAGH